MYKMRLYDQGSRTPMPSSNLDGKKWIRPATFLPEPKAATNMSHEYPKAQNTNPPAPKTSMIGERRIIDKNFLFDIEEDEELSMNSSSTLSTHPSLQKDSHTPCSHGLGKPFPSVEKCNANDICAAPEGYPFQILSNSKKIGKEENVRPARDQKRQGSAKENAAKLAKNCYEKDAFFTPELTLTESSEDSQWLDFSSSSFASNPFRVEPVKLRSDQPKQTLCLYPVSRQARSTNRPQQPKKAVGLDSDYSAISNRRPILGQYAKYSALMIRGLSVAEVSKIMAEDQVDPSIISLVMLAASENN